jgi:large subunit ribosomal protein L16
MLVPKKLKYRKPHRGRMRGKAKGGTDVQFGEYGLQALEPAWITNRQIEAARIAMTRKIRRGGKVWINIFPHKQGEPGRLRRRGQARACDVRDEWC